MLAVAYGETFCPYCIGDVEPTCFVQEEQPTWLVSDGEGNIVKNDKCPNPYKEECK
jgi:hypothetical protein